MGELAQEYEGQADFNIIPAEETNQRQDEIDEYGFTEQLHGLVAFDGDGEAVVKLPGHNYEKAEIVEAIETVLGG